LTALRGSVAAAPGGTDFLIRPLTESFVEGSRAGVAGNGAGNQEGPCGGGGYTLPETPVVLPDVSTSIQTGTTDWNHRTHETVSWLTQGGTVGAATTVKLVPPLALGTKHAFDVTSSVAAMYAGTANNGWQLRLSSETGNFKVVYASRSYTDTTYRPKLTVQFKSSLGVSCTVGGAAACASGNCVNGVCCAASSCSGCLRCNVAGQLGTCQPSHSVCADTNMCTTNERCVNSGGWVCTSDAVTCNDGKACTDDSCSAATGCVFNNNNANPCSDNNACTSADHCSAGNCIGTTITCNDGNQCTSDTCAPATGCVFNNNNANPCSDNNACTSADHCSAGNCIGTTITCNDNEECTNDSCNPGSGCVFAPKANNTACSNDGNVCTRDTCQGGVCNTPVAAGTVQCRAPQCVGVPPNAQATQ
jgi:hypothetical protein